MQDKDKTSEQLIEELDGLRHRIVILEARERERGNSTAEELSAEESELKFINLAESSTAQISIVQDDRYIYANQAFLDYHGMEADELPLITPEELMMGSVGPEIMSKAEPVYLAAMERGDNRFSFEYQDLLGCWFMTNVAIIELDGKTAFMTMVFDTTELKQAQNEMYRADKMAALGEIVAGVAHEINNPNQFIFFNLPILRRYIEAIAPLLEQRLEQDPDLTILNMPYEVFSKDVFKLLENMEHGSARITSIVSDLKNYVRSDDDQVRKAEQVSRVADRVMALAGKQVRKMVKRFDVQIADGLPSIEINAGKIEQVLINLLINAGQACDKEESWVKLTARVADDPEGWVELVVEDNGAGIREGHLLKIFEPFYTSKGRDKGTGLGLSISQRIVEEHGGSISVKSTYGEGTSFTVLLPAAPPE